MDGVPRPMSNFFTFAVLSLALVLVILCAAYVVNRPVSGYEKNASYECGFLPWGDARDHFSIQFYVIGLLFILFDLEVVFLMPFCFDVAAVSAWGFAGMLLFMTIVIFGFYYEWAIGLID